MAELITSELLVKMFQNLNDSIFLKRHQKSEVEEKRRKRWDVQRLRDLHLLQKQHQQNVATRVVRDQTQEPESFMPSTDRGFVSFCTMFNCVSCWKSPWQLSFMCVTNRVLAPTGNFRQVVSLQLPLISRPLKVIGSLSPGIT